MADGGSAAGDLRLTNCAAGGDLGLTTRAAGGDLRLTTREMARFAARGFLRFDALVPEALNGRFLEEAKARGLAGNPPGTPLSACYPGSVVREILDLPRVQGILTSLVGPEPLFDHHGVHFNPPAERLEAKGLRVLAQHTHQDSTVDPRIGTFDLQLFYFPHEVGPEMAGTRFVPGTHHRVVSEMAIARYQNLKGQQKVVCPAGTLLAMHHGIWHGGEVNRGERTRYMLKIRLNPTVPQQRLWNTADLEDATAGPAPIFDPGHEPADPESVEVILCRPEPWFELDTGRLEYMNRIRFWRALVGDPSFDADYWWSRVENRPGTPTGTTPAR